MKITLEVGKNEDLRKEVIELIRTEIRNITGVEIKDMVDEHLKTTDIAARVTSAFKDLINQQIQLFSNGYGRRAAEQMIKGKFEEIVKTSFEEFFKSRCIPFLQDYISKNLAGLGGIADLLRNITKGTKDKTK